MQKRTLWKFILSALFILSLTHCGGKEGVLLQRVAGLTDSSVDSQVPITDSSSTSNSGSALKNDDSDENEDEGEDSSEPTKSLCHVPPGNSSKAKTLKLNSEGAIKAHLENHLRDHIGPCK